MKDHAERISVTDLRNRTREVLESSHWRGRHFVVERAGQAMVAIISIAEYERLLSAAAKSSEVELAPGEQSR